MLRKGNQRGKRGGIYWKGKSKQSSEWSLCLTETNSKRGSGDKYLRHHAEFTSPNQARGCQTSALSRETILNLFSLFLQAWVLFYSDKDYKSTHLLILFHFFHPLLAKLTPSAPAQIIFAQRKAVLALYDDSLSVRLKCSLLGFVLFLSNSGANPPVIISVTFVDCNQFVTKSRHI